MQFDLLLPQQDYVLIIQRQLFMMEISCYHIRWVAYKNKSFFKMQLSLQGGDCSLARLYAYYLYYLLIRINKFIRPH